ncbi:hypothetical protein BC01_220 [Bacillus phage BC01]|nr:hypothetical protein BC01_220 [Bacillus phage BC01]
MRKFGIEKQAIGMSLNLVTMRTRLLNRLRTLPKLKTLKILLLNLIAWMTIMLTLKQEDKQLERWKLVTISISSLQMHMRKHNVLLEQVENILSMTHSWQGKQKRLTALIKQRWTNLLHCLTNRQTMTSIRNCRGVGV